MKQEVDSKDRLWCVSKWVLCDF